MPPDARLPADPAAQMRVTLPVDGSPEAQRAVQRMAACSALVNGLHVDLVHASPGLTLAAAMLPPHDDVVRHWGGQASAAALAQAQQVLEAAGVSHQVHHLTGEPGTAVAAFADEQGADLIAMGSRGLGAMHHLLLGSVALATARRAKVPVAIVR
ncbi:MAG: universal stress protein [Comamonadaceae bacterium]|nr:MAG: universal stress protein [Comamonadaceae bacterium]